MWHITNVLITYTVYIVFDVLGLTVLDLFIACTFHVLEYSAFMKGYIPHACVVPAEVRKGNWITWSCSYRWLVAAMWGLGTEPGSSERATHTLNHIAVSSLSLCIMF